MANRPAAEVVVDEPLVRALLRGQAPAYLDLELRPLSRGWDNTSMRLGDELIVRVPHRAVAAPLIASEQRWLPDLSDQLTLPIPAPVFAGAADPDAGYPWPWSIVPWFEGGEAASAQLRDSAATATRLGQFFESLHVSGPKDPPTNPYRGQPLDQIRPAIVSRIEQLDDHWNRDQVRAVFEVAAAIPAAAATESVWLHGDLHLRNLIVNEGELTAVIDWGDICTGDRATDLAAAYMLVPGHIEAVRDHAGADDGAWARALGWATHFAVMYTVMSDDEPIQRSIGENLLGVVLDALH